MEIQYKLNGEIIRLFLGLEPDSLVTSRLPAVKANFEGFEGDRHAGLTRKADGRTPHYLRGTEIRNDRQVSIVSAEELNLIAARMDLPEIRAEWLGANLLVGGIPFLTQIPPGTRLFFTGGAVLVIQAENLPCQKPGKIIQGHYKREGLQGLFPGAALHLRGLVACVERPALIQEGEQVRAEIPAQVVYNPGSNVLS